MIHDPIDTSRLRAVTRPSEDGLVIFEAWVEERDRPIGRVSIEPPTDSPVGPVAQVISSGVDQDYQHRGVGTFLYERAALYACATWGVPLSSSGARSDLSEAFWRKQERLGRARRWDLPVKARGRSFNVPHYVLTCPPPETLRNNPDWPNWGFIRPDGTWLGLQRSGARDTHRAFAEEELDQLELPSSGGAVRTLLLQGYVRVYSCCVFEVYAWGDLSREARGEAELTFLRAQCKRVEIDELKTGLPKYLYPTFDLPGSRSNHSVHRLNTMRPPKAKLEAAVKAMQLYLGSVNFVRLRDEERLYKRVVKLVEGISEVSGMRYIDAWEQIENEAQVRGALRPKAARDY